MKLTWTKERMQEYIEKADGKQLFQALWLLYQRQTSIEQVSDSTVNRNKIGFSAYDAGILSKVAKQAEKYKNLTDKQAAWLRKKIRKYSQQLADAANNQDWQPTGVEMSAEEKVGARRELEQAIWHSTRPEKTGTFCFDFIRWGTSADGFPSLSLIGDHGTPNYTLEFYPTHVLIELGEEVVDTLKGVTYEDRAVLGERLVRKMFAMAEVAYAEAKKEKE